MSTPPIYWPRVGSQPLNEFDTKHLLGMFFPELLMDGKADPTTKVRRQDVSIAQSTKHLIKVAFEVDRNDGTEEYI